MANLLTTVTSKIDKGYFPLISPLHAKHMNCNQFKAQYSQYTHHPLSNDVWDTDEYELWSEHLQDCKACIDWYMQQTVQDRGYQLSDFPCVHIAYHTTAKCNEHPNPWDCPDTVLIKTSDGYGLPIKDGGTAVVKITFCPWCGSKI